MNGKGDNSVDDDAHPVDDLNSLNLRNTSPEEEITKGMSKDKEHAERRSSLKREVENAEGCLGGGDIPSPPEKAQDATSAEDHNPSGTREDEKQSKDEDVKVNRSHQKSKKEKDEHCLDDVTCPEDGVTSPVHPVLMHSQDESTKDEHLERRSSIKQEEEGTESDFHSAEQSHTSVFGLEISTKFFIAALFALVLALLAAWILSFQPPPVQKEFNITHVFIEEMGKVRSRFPSQPSELWRRSQIHLRRHLQMTHPSEPVSLLLTSGRGAEKTLACLAQQLAAAFSSALNASVLNIDGVSKTTQDSDQVKLDIDRALKEAFEGGKRSAVIHRFEELPPGATLIFYRYCDHENAAFKKIFLTFTVLLENLELSPNISLGLVEEMVQEYLKKKFVSSDITAAFNQMDVDKLSGLWSRISHVILPVAAERTIEQHGCRE